MVISVSEDELIVSFIDSRADTHVFGEIHWTITYVSLSSSRDQIRADGSKPFGIDHEFVRQNIFAATAQVEIGMVCQVDDCVLVGRRVISNLQFVVAR